MKSYETIIVAVHYNRASMVKKSIESVTKQLCDGELLVLVDDGSTDNTLEELTKFKASNVEVLSWDNQGFTASIIQAIDSFDSKYVAIHGAGDISLDGRFKKQSQVLEDNLNVVVVGAFHNNINLRVHTEEIKKSKVNGDSRLQILKENPFSQSEVMFRRSAYKKSGGYRTVFKFAQDRDLWCRMSFFGDFYIVDEVLVERFHAVNDSVSGNYFKSLHQRYLSDFAVYCHNQRLRYGYSSDANLELLMLRYKPSYRVQKELFYNSLKILKRKEFEAFLEYRKSVSEHMLFNFFYKLIQPLVWFISKKSDKSYLKKNQ